MNLEIHPLIMMVIIMVNMLNMGTISKYRKITETGVPLRHCCQRHKEIKYHQYSFKELYFQSERSEMFACPL